MYRTPIIAQTIFVGPFSIILRKEYLTVLVTSLYGSWGGEGLIQLLEILKKCIRVTSLIKPSEKQFLACCFFQKGNKSMFGIKRDQPTLDTSSLFGYVTI
jgi:hypothetical protein